MPTVLTDRPADGVTRISLNRPEKRNALDPETRSALLAAIEAATSDPDTRAVILTGAGGAFCAGGDIASMGRLDQGSARARMKSGHRIVRAIAGAEIPFVAAVEGPAAGAGASLAALCDVVVADPAAVFAFPFLKVGLVPDWGAIHSIPRRVGPDRARRLFLLAETIDAEAAERIGLVDRLAPPGGAQPEAVEIAGRLARAPRLALAMTRRALAPLGLEEALEYEALAQSLAFTGAELAEGMAAFLEKRPPAFP